MLAAFHMPWVFGLCKGVAHTKVTVRKGVFFHMRDVPIHMKQGSIYDRRSRGRVDPYRGVAGTYEHQPVHMVNTLRLRAPTAAAGVASNRLTGKFSELT